MNELYRRGFAGDTISGNGDIFASNGGAAKYIADIRGFPAVFANTLCLTLVNLPFVNAYKY